MAQLRISTQSSHNQKFWAAAVVSLFIPGVFMLRHYAGISLAPSFFGFVFGYILQRSRFCFAASFRDIFMVRNTVLTRALLVAIILTSAGFAMVHLWSGINLEAAGKIYPVGLHTLAGGALFGLGMVIAGNCVSGCLVRMGEGYVAQWHTFIGLIIGSAVGAWNLDWWVDRFISKSPAYFLPAQMGWLLAILFQIAIITTLYFIALRIHNSESTGVKLKGEGEPYFTTLKRWFGEFTAIKSWSYITGAVCFSLANTLLLLLWGEPWAITAGLTHLSGWFAELAGLAPERWRYFVDPGFRECCGTGYIDHPLLYLALAMVLGALVSALLHREFRIRRPRHHKYRITSLAGGFILGFSSRIALGCNIGGFLGGVSSFSLHGWVFGLAILGGAYIGSKIFMRYIA